ncbi:hypothetical protein KR018_012223 [Drosophila ironensis]|nr:hypothetical protein KR018_012223 [Drosophila ironensis]
MAIRYIFVFSVVVVLVQGSNLDLLEDESLEESLHAGGVSAGGPVVGYPQGRPPIAQPLRPAVSYGQRPVVPQPRPVIAQPRPIIAQPRPVVVQPQRPISGYGAGVGGPRVHGPAPRRQAGGYGNHPAGGVAGGVVGGVIGGVIGGVSGGVISRPVGGIGHPIGRPVGLPIGGHPIGVGRPGVIGRPSGPVGGHAGGIVGGGAGGSRPIGGGAGHGHRIQKPY